MVMRDKTKIGEQREIFDENNEVNQLKIYN